MPSYRRRIFRCRDLPSRAEYQYIENSVKLYKGSFKYREAGIQHIPTPEVVIRIPVNGHFANVIAFVDQQEGPDPYMIQLKVTPDDASNKPGVELVVRDLVSLYTTHSRAKNLHFSRV